MAAFFLSKQKDKDGAAWQKACFQRMYILNRIGLLSKPVEELFSIVGFSSETAAFEVILDPVLRLHRGKKDDSFYVTIDLLKSISQIYQVRLCFVSSLFVVFFLAV